MQFQWLIDDEDLKKVQAVLRRHEDDPFVVKRVEKNLATDKPAPSGSRIWWALVACRLTSQQRSGPKSPVFRFLTSVPFPLELPVVAAESDREIFIQRIIARSGGIRFSSKIAEDLSRNLQLLEDGEWERLGGHLDVLRAPHEAAQEREVADYLADTFRGLGPKQSRNLLQILGLSQYEIPIDSRITKWLNQFGFPVRLTAGALSERAYYEFVSDGVQALCRACDVHPCVLDAAIFTSYDKGEWTADKIIW